MNVSYFMLWCQSEAKNILCLPSRSLEAVVALAPTLPSGYSSPPCGTIMAKAKFSNRTHKGRYVWPGFCRGGM
jgi:hypothetical protein